jgi:hypothetical protein
MTLDHAVENLVQAGIDFRAELTFDSPTWWDRYRALADAVDAYHEQVGT